MKHIRVFFTGLFLPLFVTAQVSFKGYEHLFTTPLSYNIYRTQDSIKVDGVLNEASWKTAQPSEDFVDIEGDKKPKPAYKTNFKMLWDDKNLYIAAELEDPHIWSYLKQHDTIVYHDNDFEVFIDPGGDSHNYFEIEVNALKTVFDLFIPKPYRNNGDGLVNWNVENLKLDVTITGTLNNPADEDKKWCIEMSVPFRSVALGYYYKVPANGTIWRMNFSRVQWNTEIRGNVYKKKTDAATGRNLPENNWVWSPQGVINMHYPERWGYVQFISGYSKEDVKPAALPASEDMKKYLWLIYYKQQDIFNNTKRYTGAINDLGFPGSTFKADSKLYTLKLQSTQNLFEATIIDNATKVSWLINQAGEIKEVMVKK